MFRCYFLFVGVLSLLNRGARGFLPAIRTPRAWRTTAQHKQHVLYVNKFQAPHLDTNNDNTREIFCNTELSGSSIEAVGFDMDYTLAQVNYASYCIHTLVLINHWKL